MISSGGGFYTGGSLMRCEAFYDGTLMHEMTYIPHGASALASAAFIFKRPTRCAQKNKVGDILAQQKESNT